MAKNPGQRKRKPPRGFLDAEIHVSRTLHDEIKDWEKANPDWIFIKNDVKLQVSIEAPPIMMCSAKEKEIFANSDYNKIKELQKNFKKDFEDIDKRIQTRKEEAFRIVTNAEPRYYVVYGENASLWIQCRKEEQNACSDHEDEQVTKFSSVYQLGRYSFTTGIVGTIDYTFEYTATDPIFDNCVLAGKMVEVMLNAWEKYPTTDLVLHCFVDNIVVNEPANLKNFAQPIIQCCQLSCIASCLCTLGMIALGYLWAWTWKKYSVKFCIFNWSTEHELVISDSYTDNTQMYRIAVQINNPTDIRIPKAKPILPPEFKLPTAIDSFCHYDMFFVSNSATFFQGCGFALKIEIDQKGSNKGFVYAYDCTRRELNHQKASENLNDYENLRQYYEMLENSNENPLKFSIQTEGIPVSFSSDALWFSSTFFPIINFNSGQKKSEPGLEQEPQRDDTTEIGSHSPLAHSNKRKYGTVSSSTENLI